MKKKRSTRSSSNRWTVAFVLVNIICLFGAALNVWLFVRSFNESLTKLNEKPIATITFKYKTAQRKFTDRVVWDRLRQSSPVYNGDTIRTAPLSEATVWFTDGNVMQLYESTMAQVYLREDGLAADLAEGGVKVDTGAAKTGMKLSSGATTVQVSAGSAMSASSSPVTAQGGGVTLQVLKGTASLSAADGAAQTVSAGDAVELSADGTKTSKPSVVVISPDPNVKVLHHTAGPVNQDFSWKTNDIPEDTPVVLEVSPDHSFSQIINRVSIAHLSNLSLALDPGTWYWRIRTGVKEDGSDAAAEQDQGASASGKVQVIESLSPVAVAPAVNYRYEYRSQMPAVRFIWSESAYATSYELTVAADSSMQNPVIRQRTSLPSSIVSTLKAGTWYWQVTPYYTINNIGLESPSGVSSFIIVQRGDLSAPQLQMPAENSFVNTKNGRDSVGFSWRHENEAVSYELRIANNEQLANPTIKMKCDDNYAVINPSQQNLTNGRWFWGVTQTDSEGNVSPLSSVRRFVAVDGDIVQRTIFPPDRYTVDVGRVQDTRFTWKTNVPYPVRMQIARTADFSDKVYDDVVSGSSYSGQTLAPGTYYWRIAADTNDMQLASPVKLLTVAGQLPAASLSDPADSTRAVIRPNTPYEYKWTEVAGADYYQVRVFKVDQNEPVFERNFIEESSIKIDMERMKEGNYRWTVQPFASETELSSRRTGVLSESAFQMKKLKPVTLVSPAHGVTLDGVQAIIKPGTAVWSSVDKTAESEFILTRTDSGAPHVVMDVKDAGTTVKLTPLHSGTYRWTVKARTVDDLDISALKEETFTILPVEPLAASASLVPADSTVFDAPYLRKSRTVVFSWAPVKNATDYIFIIRNNGGKEVVNEDIRSGTSYTVADLAVLDRGSFTWSVEALRRIEDDVVLQEGIRAESSFSINLPVLKKPTLNKAGTLYGK